MFQLAKLADGRYVQFRATSDNSPLRELLPLSDQPDLPAGAVEIIQLRYAADAAELLGVTPAEAQKELQELVKGRKTGPPRQYRYRLELRYNDETKEALDWLMSQNGESASEVIRHLVWKEYVSTKPMPTLLDRLGIANKED